MEGIATPSKKKKETKMSNEQLTKLRANYMKFEGHENIFKSDACTKHVGY